MVLSCPVTWGHSRFAFGMIRGLYYPKKVTGYLLYYQGFEVNSTLNGAGVHRNRRAALRSACSSRRGFRAQGVGVEE